VTVDLWLESQRLGIDRLYYEDLITREQRDDRLAELDGVHSDHLKKLAVLEWRRENGRIKGTAGFYAAEWGAPTTKGTIFERDSLGLSELERSPDLLLGHRPDHRLGRIVDVSSDVVGPFVTAEFDRTRQGKQWRTIVRERLEKGKSVFASPGLSKSPRTRVIQRPGGLQYKSITSAPIKECSVVQPGRSPASPGARFLYCS
jgi:hypothetical protein